MDREKKIQLSARLGAICDMAAPGLRVADVGCDHGFVPIHLVKNGISPHVIAMDVREGPLSIAAAHIMEWGLESFIETRLSDGLKNYQTGEAECMICAGMGGRLMQGILSESREKVLNFRELILQPQSELYEFRHFLRTNGFVVTEEKIIFENGKYYFPMKVKNLPADGACKKDDTGSESLEGIGGQKSHGELEELADRFGGLLLKERNPLLRRFLEENLESKEQIIHSLQKMDVGNQRIEEKLKSLTEEARYLKRAIDVCLCG